MESVLVLVNSKSGSGDPYRYIAAVEKAWDIPKYDLTFQFSQSVEDGVTKTKRAIARGISTILIIGGDGMINSIGSELVGTEVRLGVIPAGSGNGFARHFRIPLHPEEAARALLNGRTKQIDVGKVNGRYFFVTCSMAWDGALVESFEKYPFRGLVPYVFAGVQQLLEYKAQPFEVTIDGEPLSFKHPLIFTVANLSQFGSDFLVAPAAEEDNGVLELVAIEKKNMARVLSRIRGFIAKNYDQQHLVTNRRFKTMTVHRHNPSPVQIDGELLSDVADIHIEVRPGALKVIIPPLYQQSIKI